MADNFGDSLIEIFAFETNKFLSDIEKILIKSESDNEAVRESVPEIFRIMHTIKSSAAMMSFTNISKTAHAIEDLFYFVRENNPQNIDYSKTTDLVFNCVDYIKNCLECGNDDEDPAALINSIRAYLEEIKKPDAVYEKQPEVVPAVDEEKPALPDSTDENSYKLRVLFKKDCIMLSLRAFEVFNRIKGVSDNIKSTPEKLESNDEKFITEKGLFLDINSQKTKNEIIELIKKSPFVESVDEDIPQPLTDSKKNEITQQEILSTDEDKKEEINKDNKKDIDRRSTDRGESAVFANIEISKLDVLMDIAGELIIAQMALEKRFETTGENKENKITANLKKLVLEMQEAVLTTRMVPIKDTFYKMQRIIRDMNRKLQKDVQFIIIGEETEIDRNVADSISSPLMHIIRNSVDHGIEPAEERQKSGKPAQGRVELTASSEGRDIVITIKDDGKGFDRDRILAKAIKNGIVDEKDVPSMTDEDIYSLVFLPGFSTSRNVTEFSGRGVGMDVVHTTVKKMRGEVTAASQKGKGTVITIRLPLTLGIIDAFIVQAGEHVCTIPMASIHQIFKVYHNNQVREINGQSTIILRKDCYRVINLLDIFDVEGERNFEGGVMLTFKSGIHNIALFVNDVIDSQHVVIKPVPNIFERVKYISGCTILGDGKISLILDVKELFNSGKG